MLLQWQQNGSSCFPCLHQTSRGGLPRVLNNTLEKHFFQSSKLGKCICVRNTRSRTFLDLPKRFLEYVSYTNIHKESAFQCATSSKKYIENIRDLFIYSKNYSSSFKFEAMFTYVTQDTQVYKATPASLPWTTNRSHQTTRATQTLRKNIMCTENRE